ncbi:MAG: hypothetical protein HS116_17130 [Planctomycetes bacterium]|nr:hypothetical protein [Planctomycetota bacterium]
MDKRAWTAVAAVVLILGLVAVGGPALAGGQFVAELPDFQLEDPAGAKHTDESFAGSGAVFIITIPNVKHGDHQGRWSRWLRKKEWPATGPKLVLLEDMAQSAHKEKALEAMKEKYKPGQNPVLLLDHTGEVRRAFRVPQDETVVLIFDKTGKLVNFCDQPPTEELAKQIRGVVDTMQ